jgi:N,N'-diacetyllegionaminate synthase
MKKVIHINKTTISNNSPCFIIAEGGVNHNGSKELALELVREAKKVGADCIKFQTFKAESVVTKEAPKAKYQLKVTDNQESQLDMLKKLELDFDDYKDIIALCQELDIQFLSTPYNEEDADFLNNLGVDAFKIASGQLVEYSFLEYVAKFGKPMIISTGMGNLAEVFEAVKTIEAAGNEDLVVLQCTTNYPSKIEDANIYSMKSIGEALGVLVGYSDHVPNNYACYASIALGATVLEKHFTLDKNMEGPDHSSSLNPSEFEELVKGIRAVEVAMGSAVKQPSAAEIANTEGMRRSIVLKKAVDKGTILNKEHLTFKRPATGIEPKRLNEVIGRKVIADLSENTILKEVHLSF